MAAMAHGEDSDEKARFVHNPDDSGVGRKAHQKCVKGQIAAVCAVASVTQHRIRETCIGCGIVPPFSTPMEESGGQGRIRLKNPCISSNRLPWLWPYPWRQSATNLIFCVAGPSKCRRLGVCFPDEHSLLQSPLHREAFPRRALPAGRQSQWDLIPVRGGESATLPQLSEMDRAIARRTG